MLLVLHYIVQPKLLTVYALLVRKSLRLLRLVPVQDQSVSEGQSCAGIRGRLIAIVQRTRKCGFDVADGLFLEVFGGREGLGHLYAVSTVSILPR